MVHYSLDPENPTKSCTSRGSNLPANFKNISEAAKGIKSMHFQRATKCLKDVIFKEGMCVI